MKNLCLLLTALATLAVSSWARAQEFVVHRSDDDSRAFWGELGEEFDEIVLGITVQHADFSAFDEPGEYYLEVPGVGRSVDFHIGEDVYDGELVNAMLGFYGWRSGIDIEFERQGVVYAHAAGHLNDALLDYIDDQTGVMKDGVGGWYDAGDYGKYLPTAASAVCAMLTAWEMFEDRLVNIELSFIPEHGGDLPDYLDEIKWEVDWVSKMAYDDGSGRVHHQLNSATFPGFVLPEEDDSDRLFARSSSAAIAQFVATLAKATRAFEPYDDLTDEYSKTLLEAAWRSYEYLQENPEDEPYDDSVRVAGSYPTDNAAAFRMWAAAELWETTGDDDVLEDFESRINEQTRFVPNFSWDTPKNFALITYLLSQREGRDEELVALLEESLASTARSILNTHDRDGWGRGYPGYYWGSNAVIARMCMVLHAQNILHPDPALLDACTDQIGFLYGRNQYNRSQVTGSGIEPPENPHHRLSGSDDVVEPYPGLLVGGGQQPNNWYDEQGDFASNEVAINWNSALVFALAGFVEGDGAGDSMGVGPVDAEDCEIRLSSVGYLPDRAKVATVQRDCELPSNFQCEFGDKTMSGDTHGPTSTIDDFEDRDMLILPTAGRNGAWSAFDDGTDGMRSDPEIRRSEREGSESALCIEGGGFTWWGGGMGFSLNGQQAYDASVHTGVTFWAKGSATEFRLLAADRYSSPGAGICSSCNDHFRALFDVTPQWKEYTIAWPELFQAGFGDRNPSVCPSALFGLQFQWPSNTDFELCIDDLAFTSAEGTKLPESDTGSPAGNYVASGGGGCACRLSASRQRAPGTPWGLALIGLLLVRRR